MLPKRTRYLAAALAAAAMLATPAHAGVTGVTTTTASTAETIACNSGVSPCSVPASTTTILNANVNRDSVCFQHVGTTTNIEIALGGAASATVYNLLLGPPGNATGLPSSFCFSGGATVWGGVISAFGGTGASLAVVAY